MGVTQAQAHHLPQDLGPPSGLLGVSSPLWRGPSLTARGPVDPWLGAPRTPPSISLTTPRERPAPLLPPALDPGQTVPLMATQTCPPEAVLVSRVQTQGLGCLSSGLARVGNVCASAPLALPVLEGLVST